MLHCQSLKSFLSKALDPYRVFIALMIAVSFWLFPFLNLKPQAEPTPIENGVILPADPYSVEAFGPCSNVRCDPGTCCSGGRCTTGCGGGGGDPLPPQILGALACSAPGINGWCIGSLMLNLNAVDPQGASLIISGDVNGLAFACPAGATSCSIPLTAEGLGGANYVVNSATGLQATGAITYQLDSTTPQIDGSLSGVSGANGWFISSVTAFASGSDTTSGIASVNYSVDGGGSWEAFPGSLDLSDGVYILVLQAYDNAGNQSETSQTIKIDTTTPSLDLSLTGTSGNNGWYRSNAQVSATASDIGSGLSSLEYALDGGAWTSYSGPLTFTNGAQSLSVRAMDAAGNVTQTDQQISVDTVTPSVSLSISGTQGANDWYVSTIQVGASGSDGGSGLASFEYSLNEGAWTPYTGALPYSDGHYSLKFRAIDKAGNVTITPAQTYSIDTIPPLIDIPKSSALGRTVEYGAQDNGSGLSTLRVVIEDEDERWPKVAWDEYPTGTTHRNGFDWDGKFKDGTRAPSGTYYATVKVSDIAGNESSQTGSIRVEDTLWNLIIPPFIAPVNTPPPTAAPFSSGGVDFGGESNYDLSETQTGSVAVGGGSNEVHADNLGTVSFGAASTSRPSTTNTDTSNILWGATAAAAVGAFVAEAARRRDLAENGPSTYRRARGAYQAALNSFATTLETAQKLGMSAVEVAKLKDDIAQTGKIGGSLGAAQQFIVKETERQAQESTQAQYENWLRTGDNPLPGYEDVTEEERAAMYMQTAGYLERLEAERKWESEQAYQDFRAEERSGGGATSCQQTTQAAEKRWWDKTIDWVDDHQTLVAIGIGVAAGAVIVLSAGTAAPLVAMGWAALAAASMTAGGTIALNAYYDRPLGTNVLKNVLVAGGTAAATVFIFGGSLTAGLIKAGNSVTAFCVANPTACAKADWALNAWDAGEQLYLGAKVIVQRALGDEIGAAQTQDEFLMELMDGGMPGNLAAAELGDEAIELVEKYGDDVAELVAKYGDDAVDIIGAYGDDGIELLQTYGDDAVKLIQDYGTPAIHVLKAVDPKSATKLLETLDDDVLDYAVNQGPEAVVALSRWSEDELTEHGPELALRAEKDAKVLKDIRTLLTKKPLNPANLTDEQRELIQAIAENSKQYDKAGQIVLGKWVDQGSGFVEVARDTGSAHYNPHPDMWNLLGELGDENREKVAWLINEQVVQSGIGKGLPFEYTLNGVPVNNLAKEQSAVRAIFAGATDTQVMRILGVDRMPIRMKELMKLQQSGYEFVFDTANNSYILMP